MSALSATLVVATKDRPEDCRELLRLLDGREDLPDRILVVDASEDDRTRAVCEDTPTGSALHSRLSWHRASRAGLASQRNEALTLVETDLVHFLDDDSRPMPGYFEAIEEWFAADGHERVVGVTGLVVNPGPARRVTALHRLFLLTPEQGRLNRAGRNAVVLVGTEPFEVDCLSGCTMSMRAAVARELRFDEALERGATGGYALGEDLEMSVRLAHVGELWCLPQARLRHEESVTNRSRRLVYEHAASAFRRRLADDPQVPVARWGFWWSTLGDMLIACLNKVVGRDADGFRVAAAVFGGARDTRVRRALTP